MSIKLMAEAWEMCLKGNEKSVLLCLADFANDDGFCFPSWKTILNKCNISKSTLSISLKSLENKKLIMRFSRKRENGSASSNGYQVIKNVGQSSKIELGGRVRKSNYQSSKIEHLYEPPIEPPILKEKDKKENLPEWLNREAWDEWVKYRKQKKNPLTELSIKKQLKLLEENKYDHIEIINQSIQNGWTGLFEIKKQTAKKSLAERNREAMDAYEQRYSEDVIEGVIE